MDYLQTLFSFFNAPLFATFVVGMFWKRMTPAAGWIGLVAGTLSALVVWLLDRNGLFHVFGDGWHMSGQGGSFVAAGAAFVVDIVVSVAVSLTTTPKPASELVGLVYSETPKAMLTDTEAHRLPWYRQPVKLAGIGLVMVVTLNVVFR